MNSLRREIGMLLSLFTQNFLADKTHDLFPQHPVFARLNWDEFATATKYPSLDFNLSSNRHSCLPCAPQKRKFY